jgi:hypothetical protein
MKKPVQITHPPVSSSALKTDQRDIDAYTTFFKDVNEQAELFLIVNQQIMNEYNINLVNIDDNPSAPNPPTPNHTYFV